MLLTKLHRPQVTKEHVYRDHLINLLNKNMYKPLTLVSAGAGYGKSMLISSWLEKSKIPYAWVSLSDEDNEIREFIRGILTSVQKVFPKALVHLNDYVEAAELPPISKMAESLINGLDEIDKEFVLVLDDYHLIQNEQINELINQLLQFPPQLMHLVIICRSDPFLNLSSLRAHSRINEIRAAELCFNESEILELLKNIFQTESSRAISHKLMQQTEGWITGLRLLLLMVKKGEDLNESLEKIHASNPTTTHFLLEEVISNQPEPIRNCIIKMSILDRFSDELIDQVCFPNAKNLEADSSGKEVIQTLLDANLFTISLDYEGKWYRFHHLFQEMLQNQLKKQHSIDEIKAIHLKASEWFESKGLLDEAIAHAHKANAEEKVVAIIIRHRNDYLRKDQWYTAEKWQSNISESTIEKTPELVLTKIWSAFHRAQMQDIFPLIGKLSELLQHEEADEALIGELNWFNGLFAYFGNDAQKSIEYLELAEKQLMPSNSHALGGAQVYLAFARLMAGLKEKAINELNTSLRGVMPSDNLHKCRLYSGLASVYYMAGDLVAALDPSEKLYQTGKDCNFDFSEGWGSWFLGTIYMRQGRFSKAEEMFLTAYEKRYAMGHDGAVDALIGLVLLYELTGQVEKSQNSLDKMEGFIGEIDNPSMLIKLKSCKARCALLSENANSAAAELIDQQITSSVPYLFTWIEIPGFTKVRVFIAEGTDEGLSNAQQWIKDIRKQTIAQHNACQDIEVAVLEVVLMEKLGKREQALNLFNQIIEKGERNKWMFPFIEQGKSLKDLLAALSDTNKNSKYIRLILKAINERESEQLNSIQIEKQKVVVPVRNNVISDTLSLRETDVLKFVAQGLRNKEIADKLFLSTDTIKKHVYNTFQKLQVSNRMELANKAKQLGLLDLN